MSRFRRSRWLVTTGIIGAAALAASAPNLLPAGADSVPVLPSLTPAQLLQKVRTTQVTTFSGDLEMSANLGLPDLGSFGPSTPNSLLTLLTGTHTAHVWVDGPEHQRFALDGSQSETDWIHNGNDLWAWESTTQHVTHVSLPAEAAAAAKSADQVKSATGIALTTGTSTDASHGVAQLTPDEAANQLLALIDPSTEVTVRTPGYVAGRPVYELVVSPRSANSTIQAGVIAVDADTGLPLQVRIEARGQSSPAVKLGFTSISFDKPAASTFNFTPPPGATVDQASTPDALLPLAGRTDRVRAHKVVRNPATGKITPIPDAPNSSLDVSGNPNSSGNAARKVTTVGTNWDTVAIVSGQPLIGRVDGLFGDAPSINTPGGTGHLLSTALINVIQLDDGRLAIGAVTPSALAAAVPAA